MGTMVFQPYDTLRPMIEDRRVTSIFFTELSADQMRRHLHEALGVYIRAMGYPAAVRGHRAPLWAEHALRHGWRAIAAFAQSADTDAGTARTLVGIAYGYHGGPAYWWDRQVRDGLQRTGGDTAILTDYFELTELHVEPTFQGHGIGHGLLERLLDGRPEARVLLSTPEAGEEGNRAWALYRRAGFTDVLRDFLFTGDHRPFAVLCRTLPGADRSRVRDG